MSFTRADMFHTLLTVHKIFWIWNPTLPFELCRLQSVVQNCSNLGRFKIKVCFKHAYTFLWNIGTFINLPLPKPFWDVSIICVFLTHTYTCYRNMATFIWAGMACSKYIYCVILHYQKIDWTCTANIKGKVGFQFLIKLYLFLACLKVTVFCNFSQTGFG